MPSGNIRGHAPVSPRDLTGKRIKELQQQQELGRLNATRDVDAELKQAYKRGYATGWSEAIVFVTDNYAVYDLEEDGE